MAYINAVAVLNDDEIPTPRELAPTQRPALRGNGDFISHKADAEQEDCRVVTSAF